jgi:hypothetical protein
MNDSELDPLIPIREAQSRRRASRRSRHSIEMFT